MTPVTELCDSKSQDSFSGTMACRARSRDFIGDLEPLNIQGRYPGDKDRLSSFLNAARCKKMLVETKDLYEWIKATL